MPDRSDVLETLGRVGYAIKGLVYLLLGFIALDAALTPSSPEGSSGMFRWVAGGPLGNVVLGVLAAGLAAYALWRTALALLSPPGEGVGAGKRAYYAFSGLTYGLLAYQAGAFLLGDGGGGRGGAEERTGVLLSLPYGRVLVGGVAAVILAFGIRQLYRAYAITFTDRLDLHHLSPTSRTWAVRLARAGMAARGVVYLLVAGFFASAAFRSSEEASGGLKKALMTLKEQPFGPYLLGAVAVGLVGYGVYCGLNARYRRYG
jgi:hypothetical protein